MTTEQLPKLLYHYTDSQGFLGIVRSKTLWASSIRHLNDSAEYHHVADIVEDAIQLLENPLSAPEKALLQRLLARRSSKSGGIPRFLEEMNVSGAIYVACFSGHRNDLSQWRAYGKNGGVCLGLETAKLRSIASHTHLQFARCVYQREAKIARTTAVLTQILDQLRRLPEVMQKSVFDGFERSGEMSLKDFEQLQTSGTMQQMSDLGDQFDTEIDRLAPTMKHESFEVEDEYRLIATVNPYFPEHRSPTVSTVQFRSGARMPIPYVEIDLNVSPDTGGFSNILVGPTSEPVLSMVTYSQIMDHFGFPCGGVGSVSTPYREEI